MARESTIQILYGSGATAAPTDLSNGEFAYAHGSKQLFIGSNSDNTALWLGAEILDEDGFSSNSDTALATQQSIKSYVDSAIGASAGVVNIEGLVGAVNVETLNGITHSADTDLTIQGITATTSQIGVAYFDSNDFTVTDGLVSIAAGGVGSTQIEDGGVGSTQIADGSVGRTKIGDDAVGFTQIEDGSIQTTKIGDGAITTIKIADNAVGFTQIEDGSISGVKITDGGVGITQLEDSSITTPKLAASAVSNDKLATPNINLEGDQYIGGEDQSFALGSTLTIEGQNSAEFITTTVVGDGFRINLTDAGFTLGGVHLELKGTDATPAFDLTDATNYPAASLSGTIDTATQLNNNSVSYGGVSVALGSSDATPAFNLADATNYGGTLATSQLSGTIDTATQLNNNSVSYGGVSVALGSSDATPAFDLTDATNYGGTLATSQLSGTISNGQLDNSVVYFTDGTSSGSVALGATLGIQGTTNEVTVAFSAGNFTVGLPDDVTIAGNLTVNGTVTTVDTTNLVIEDPLIKLAKNNNSTDSVDIGFYGLYDTSGSQDLYAGLFRDQSDDKFRLFTGLQSEPTTTVNTGGTGYTVGTLVANINGGSF